MDTATRSVAHRPELVATMPAETMTAARTLTAILATASFALVAAVVLGVL